jgi:TipAS antibiotic-recognition protein
MRTSPWKLSKDEVDALRRRRDAAGGAAFDSAWAELLDALREEIERGSDSQSDAVQALARRWQSLVDAFTGGDESIERGLYDRAAAYRQLRAENGRPIPDLVGYIQKALGK